MILFITFTNYLFIRINEQENIQKSDRKIPSRNEGQWRKDFYVNIL